MLLSKIDSLNAIAQFFTVIVLFVLVLGITYMTTKWIANYQKISGKGKNFEEGKLSLIDLAYHAEGLGEVGRESGKQEFLESIINQYL